MPVSTEAEQALHHFVGTVLADQSLQDQLNLVEDIDALRHFIQSVEPVLTGAALIPHEQATRPPKILVESGQMNRGIDWRLLRCTGGPLVLQLICSKANFAIWIESC